MAESTKMNTYTIDDLRSSGELAKFLAVLRPHLPVSLPVYRRLQFGGTSPASKLISNLSVDALDRGNPSPPEEPWIAAFVDRSRRPETEVWLCGSWEDEDEDSSDAETAEKDGKIDALVREMLLSMKALEVTTSIHEDLLPSGPPKKDMVGRTRADYVDHFKNPSIVLLGGVHERTTKMISRLGVVSPQYQSSLIPNWTFVWELERLPALKSLPQGLKWGEVRHRDIEHVRSRNDIPRFEKSLKAMPSVAIFPDDENEDASPVAWALIGFDGALTSLYVEPEWRGKGLAKAVTTKIFREKMDRFHENGVTRWAHSYVIVGNKQSEGMSRSLGGVSNYEAFWLRLDLDQL